jgi:hypothetical protein
VFSRSTKRSSERAAVWFVALLSAPLASQGALTQDEAWALAADVRLYADAYACDEEPLAERLRSTVLLIVAGSGKTGADVVDARQRFLDGLRDRARAGGRPTAAGCAKTLSDLRARLAELESVRFAPPAAR